MGDSMNSNSVKKRLSQSNVRRLRNRKRRSTMNTAIKKAINAIKLNNQEIIKASIKIIAKTASKGTIHKKNAANKISKIMIKNYRINKI
jgi:small subunit ribosomal protein S20